MAYRLGGRNSLPYLGVEAPTPANTVLNTRSPTSTDSQNFNIGTWWLRTNATNSAQEVWILISLVGGVATWVQLYPSNAGGASQFIEDVGVANELLGVINILGGADPSGNTNINTFGSGNTIEIILNETIQWPDTTSGQGAGAIFLGGTRFMHNFGENSTFLGSAAGPATNDSSDNTGIGSSSLVSITTGEFNSAFGSNSGFSLTTGDSNTFLGDLAGSQYTDESNNISINHIGVPTESGIIRIGTSGNQVGCYIAGIYSATNDDTTVRLVTQDSVEKLAAYTLTSSDGSLTITVTAGNIDITVT